MTLYRVHWRSTVTGQTGHGHRAMDHDTATALAARMNETFPWLRHWIEPDRQAPVN